MKLNSKVRDTRLPPRSASLTSLAKCWVVINLIMGLAPISTCPNALTKKVLSCKCENILQDTCISFSLVPRLTQVGAVLTITQNDSSFIFQFIGSLNDKMQMHACL